MIKDSAGLKIVWDEKSSVPHTSWGHLFSFSSDSIEEFLPHEDGRGEAVAGGVVDAVHASDHMVHCLPGGSVLELGLGGGGP